MRRVASQPRIDWQSKVETLGLTWHTLDQPYWNEAAFYDFSVPDVDILEAATNELEATCLAAVQHIIDNRLYSQMRIPENAISLVESSWGAEPPSLYGRFDLAYCGEGPPKLLEYNADTPTSLLEASVVHWYWQEELHRESGQFNSIHDRLIALWKELAPCLPGGPAFPLPAFRSMQLAGTVRDLSIRTIDRSPQYSSCIRGSGWFAGISGRISRRAV